MTILEVSGLWGGVHSQSALVGCVTNVFMKVKIITALIVVARHEYSNMLKISVSGDL